MDELNLIDHLAKKLAGHHYANEVKAKYFNGHNRLKDLKISIPPTLVHVGAVVGWPGTSVQVLEERLDFEGFIGADELAVNDFYRQNDLDSEGSLAHLDALIYGTGFVIVGAGAAGEADPLITVESPHRMTAIHDLRTRRLTAALSIDYDEDSFNDRPVSGTLYLENENIVFNTDGNGQFLEVDRWQHNYGRVLVARFVNQPRSSDTSGRSEITRAVRYYTDSAMRTLLGAEVAREFYSAPQRYALGAEESVFKDSDGNNLNPWSVIQGRMLAIPYNEAESVMPQVGQFQSNSPLPYFEQIRALAQMLAAETAIPASYLGFQTDNPASADAIRQMEARLVKRAERRQRQFGRTWSEVAKLGLLVRDGSIPDAAANLRPVWRDASTPTRAAAADEAVKLISAGILTADSEITYNRIGLSDSDKEVLKEEKARAAANDLIAGLVAQPETQQIVTAP